MNISKDSERMLRYSCRFWKSYPAMEHLDKEHHSTQVVIANLALMRVGDSFKSVSLLIRKHFLTEAVLVQRLILEQIAWSFVVSKTKKDSPFSIKPTKCITELKRSISSIGSTYGFMSNIAHLYNDSFFNYISLDEEKSTVYIKYSLEVEESITLMNLIMLENFFLVFEFINQKDIDRPLVYKKSNNQQLVAQEKSNLRRYINKEISLLVKRHLLNKTT